VNLRDRQQSEQWVINGLTWLRRPCVVLLEGDLGAGKTQFVNWFLQALGAPQVGASPTFAIHHSYATPSGVVDHLDLYRLQDDSELESCGFWDLLAQPKALLFVEWANRLPDDVWPKDWRRIRLVLLKQQGEGRQVSVEIRDP